MNVYIFHTHVLTHHSDPRKSSVVSILSHIFCRVMSKWFIQSPHPQLYLQNGVSLFQRYSDTEIYGCMHIRVQ